MIRRSLKLMVVGVVMLAVGSTAVAESIDLEKQMEYLLNSKAIPLAVLKQCCNKDSLAGYPGVNITYNKSLLDKSKLAWNITAKNLPSQMKPDSTIVGSSTFYNCDPKKDLETDATVDCMYTDTHMIETDVHFDIGTEVSVEGKDEILGTGVDVGLKMSLDFGAALKEGEKYSKDFTYSGTVKPDIPPLSKVDVKCNGYSFTFDDHSFTMDITLSGKVSLPTLDYAFKDGPSGHLPAFSFNIEDVLTEDQRTVSTDAKLTGKQYGVKIDCAAQAPQPLTDADKNDASKCKN